MTNDLAERLHAVTVLIVGDVMLDEYIIGSVTRISPEAPVPVLDVNSRKHVLGGAANVANNVSVLGASAILVGLAADDAAGATLRQLIAAARIQGALVNSGDRCTISKTRIVAGRQQVVRIDHENKGPVSADLQETVLKACREQIHAADVVVLSDYSKGLLTPSFCAAIIEEAHRLRKPVVVDPKGQDFRKYAGCTIITPNVPEAARATGIEIDSEAALHRAGAALEALLPGACILITRGADGMTLYQEDSEPLTVPTVARQVYDVVGAGDTVVATLAAAYGAGIGMARSMQLANIAAGIVVDKPGTATTTVDEILSHDEAGALLGSELSDGIRVPSVVNGGARPRVNQA